MTEQKRGFFRKLLDGLSKTRKEIADKVDQLFHLSKRLDDDFFEGLEEILIGADVGYATTEELIDALRAQVKADKIKDAEQVKDALRGMIKERLSQGEPMQLGENNVFLVVGVNGVGKTTAIGKLAHNYKAEGYKVLLAAADTFRAAAADQLAVWAQRAGVEIIRQNEGSDPAAVVYDALGAAKSRGMNMVLCDTAGRLHNKTNLMQELGKIGRVIERQMEQAHKEVFLVLDGSTGQNAISQAREFLKAVPITGLIVTKLDGTAKGGVVLAIFKELNVPVRFICTGEGIEDIQPFDAESFAQALI